MIYFPLYGCEGVFQENNPFPSVVLAVSPLSSSLGNSVRCVLGPVCIWGPRNRVHCEGSAGAEALEMDFSL